MVERRRTESALTGRPLRDRVIGQTRQLASIADSLTPSRAGADIDADLETDVSSSLETIHKVTETYGVLLDKLSAYELKVRDLARQLAEESRATGEALRAAAVAERAAREAQEEATRAQAEAEQSAAAVGELERQLGALRSQTTKLMSAVDQLFPDLDEPTGAAPGLRVVR